MTIWSWQFKGYANISLWGGGGCKDINNWDIIIKQFTSCLTVSKLDIRQKAGRRRGEERVRQRLVRYSSASQLPRPVVGGVHTTPWPRTGVPYIVSLTPVLLSSENIPPPHCYPSIQLQSFQKRISLCKTVKETKKVRKYCVIFWCQQLE